MIISHRFRFIFLKTRKTAGTSVEIALSRYCGPHDIITPIFGEDEALRSSLGYPGPRNYHLPFTNYTPKAFLRLLRGKKRASFYNHMRAYRVKAIIGQKIWNSYFTFCIERNPWDKAVSQYYWRTKNQHPRPSFRQFMNSKSSRKLSNFPVYSIFGKVGVDRVLRYEQLTQELDQLRTILGLPGGIELPSAKSNYRSDTRDYREIIDEKEKQKIARICRKEIKLLGYTF